MEASREGYPESGGMVGQAVDHDDIQEKLLYIDQAFNRAAFARSGSLSLSEGCNLGSTNTL